MASPRDDDNYFLFLINKGFQIYFGIGIEPGSMPIFLIMPISGTISWNIFIEEPEGGFMVRVEELPATISYGKTIEEARENIFEAIELVLDCNRDLAEQELLGKSFHKEMLCFA